MNDYLSNDTISNVFEFSEICVHFWLPFLWSKRVKIQTSSLLHRLSTDDKYIEIIFVDCRHKSSALYLLGRS